MPLLRRRPQTLAQRAVTADNYTEAVRLLAATYEPGGEPGTTVDTLLAEAQVRTGLAIVDALDRLAEALKTGQAAA